MPARQGAEGRKRKRASPVRCFGEEEEKERGEEKEKEELAKRQRAFLRRRAFQSGPAFSSATGRLRKSGALRRGRRSFTCLGVLRRLPPRKVVIPYDLGLLDFAAPPPLVSPAIVLPSGTCQSFLKAEHM